MMAGIYCALRSPEEEGPRTSPTGGERPPLPLAELVTKFPPRAKRQRMKGVNPPPSRSGSQHIPAPPLGAVGQHHSSQIAKNRPRQQLCCIYA